MMHYFYILKNKKIHKLISGFIIFIIFASFVVFSQPHKAMAVLGVEDTVEPGPVWAAILAGQGTALATIAGATTTLTVWETIKKIALQVIAKNLLNKLTQDTINWINSGFSGNPFYLTNTEAFFKDIVKYEVRNLVDVYAYNKNKFPFGKQFALNTINAYQRQLEDNTAYSLSKVINDPVYLESYRNDFNVGGWNGFLINTQYPQNNYIGFQMLATEELARKLEGTSMNAAQKVQDTLQKSQGFLAPQTCTTNKLYNNGKNEFLQPTWTQSKEYQDINKKYNCGEDIAGVENICKKQWTTELEKAKIAWEKINTCPGGLTTTTPGTIVGDQIKNSLSSKIRKTELGAAIGNDIGAVLDALFSKLFNSATGLLKSSGPTPPPTTIPGGGGDGGSCTGGNTKCTCVEGVSSYSVYEGAIAEAENKAYPNGLPAGTTPAAAQAAVCAAYTGPGSCKPASLEDEVIITGLPSPYVTVSIDFLAGNPYYLWAHAVAACEAGVQ